MAAGICKNTMFTALFAGTVFKGPGTRPVYRAVKIQYFAQSAGNFSTYAEGSSETTRADPLTTFNARFGKLIDRSGYFTTKKGLPTFQLTISAADPILPELQAKFGAVFCPARGSLIWRTAHLPTVFAVAETANGYISVERRFRQFVELCQLLQLTPRRPLE